MKTFVAHILLFFLCSTSMIINAQSRPDFEEEGGWNTIINAGLDLSSLFQINPKVGAGQSQIGFGGAFSLQSTYVQTRLSWNNAVSLNYGVQKSGFGSVGGIKAPLQKSIDQFRLSSKLGYKASLLYPKANFLYTLDFSFVSQFTKTYPGNFLNEPDPSLVNNGATTPISRFLSPATSTFSLGIDYQPTDQLSIFYAPASFKAVIVTDDLIADSLVIIDNNPALCSGRGLHGNPIDCDDGTVKNADLQLGSLLKITYNDQFSDSRVFLKSQLSLYSNYLNQPGKIDVDWVNELGITIVSGLQLSLWSNLFYDYDVPVQKTDNLRIEEGRLIKGVSFAQQILLKYSKEF